jgi:catechol 2,3-dioxygenase-like lactoylglutathione lyase family enzyme
MLHHVSLGTNDVVRAQKFYDPVLKTIGLKLIKQSPESLDYGSTQIEFSLEMPSDKKAATAGNGTHIAFAADSRKSVDAFHRAALENGGTDAGAPGLRPEYDANYYGAFVLDPDGNKIEAVTFYSK